MFVSMTLNFRAKRRHLSFSAWTRGFWGGLLALLSLPACKNDFLTDGVVVLTTGQETDAWTADPPAKNVLLEMVQDTGRTTLAKVAAPVDQISIGTGGPNGVVAHFEATAFDADANVVMKGSTVPLGIYGFEGAQIGIFMGRLGGLSRAPGDLLYPWHHPQMAVLYHGYLLISGGDEGSANLDVYDMPRWYVVAQQPQLPKVPGSWAVAGPKLLLIDQTSATWLDLSTSATSDVSPPGELAYDAIVGGETIGSPGDPQYIVGATRSKGEPTDQVLRVDPDSTLHFIKLNTPRLGASAALVNGQLVVVGGSDTGAGAEIANSGDTAFVELPFPSDARIGAAIVAKDSTTVILAGGRDPKNADDIAGFRTMDLSCTQDCSQVPIEGADFAFLYPRLFSLDDSRLLAVGEDPKTAETHVFSFDLGLGHELHEFALRTPRSQASAFLLPNGQVGVLGGDTLDDQTPAKSVELFFPSP
jgi:hypothetical protein